MSQMALLMPLRHPEAKIPLKMNMEATMNAIGASSQPRLPSPKAANPKAQNILKIPYIMITVPTVEVVPVYWR